ncbi:MAG TPA: PH domain-containing protein [Acidimicrobiales bacterium]|nr:PH domain-containing protein [Acidimicrobiales bacterium]
MGNEGRAPQFFGVAAGIDRAARGVGLLFVLVALLITTVGIRLVGAILVWLICLLVLLVIWRCYLTPYVELTDDGLVVQGAFAEHHVDYAAVTGMDLTPYGLRIETATQGRVIAWAVQKSAIASWRHRRTRADEVVEQIAARLPDPTVVPAASAPTR